jgi:hypothetical protein
VTPGTLIRAPFQAIAPDGRLAQLVERLVYTENVGGSSPSSPTNPSINQGVRMRFFFQLERPSRAIADLANFFWSAERV